MRHPTQGSRRELDYRAYLTRPDLVPKAVRFMFDRPPRPVSGSTNHIPSHNNGHEATGSIVQPRLNACRSREGNEIVSNRPMDPRGHGNSGTKTSSTGYTTCGMRYQDMCIKVTMYIATTITAAYPAALQDLPPLGL